MKRSILLALALLLLQIPIFATAQYPDKIIYKGKEYDLHSNPMEEYFKSNPDKLPKTNISSSALWRGYVATFEIDNGQLYLKDIKQQFSEEPNEQTSYETKWRSILDKVVPKDTKLKIDWFSGLLVLPQGKVINYVHMGYGSTFEKYTLLSIKSGNFIEERDYDYKNYEEFKEKQYKAFKKTPEFKKIVAQLKKDRNADEKFVDTFLRNFITSYTSEFLVN